MRNMLIAGAVAGLLAATGAQAQSSSGNITGEAKAGDTIIVKGVDTGLQREITLAEDGKYNLRRLPLGDYVVIVKHADGTSEPAKGVSIRAGATARVK